MAIDWQSVTSAAMTQSAMTILNYIANHTFSVCLGHPKANEEVNSNFTHQIKLYLR